MTEAKAFLAAERKGLGATMIDGRMADRATDRINRVALKTALRARQARRVHGGGARAAVSGGDPLRTAREAALAIERLYAFARERLRGRVLRGGTVDPAALDADQLAAHALAYVATDLAASEQILAWAERYPTAETHAIARVFIAEVTRELRSAVWLGATEAYPVSEMHVTPAEVEASVGSPAIARWADEESAGDRYTALARTHAAGAAIPVGLADDTLMMMRGEFRKFVTDRVLPLAQGIHRRDELIPMDLIRAMSELGVFGITIPEAYGGQGLGKIAMCVITEELSRGYIGVGSLGTRAEIAAELILHGGTDAQKERWLPDIAAGAVLPTAVFTEPNHGSDLAHLKTRASRRGDGGWRIDGNKTWITHASTRHADDGARAHGPGQAGPRRSVDVPRREDGRAGERRVPRPGPQRNGDQGPRLPRNEGVRAVVRRLPRAAGGASRRRRQGSARASGIS